TLVGRHPNCNLPFLDEGEAYYQCALVNTKEGLWCVDLLSPRGTVLNGRPARLVLLRDGDLLEVGRASLVVRVGPEAPQPLSRPDPAAAALSLPQSPRSGLEAAVAVFEPLRGLMEQFQQSFVTMARM